MIKLIHHSDGRLVTDDPWETPGTRVLMNDIIPGSAVRLNHEGTITEDCIRMTAYNNKLLGWNNTRQYVLWDGFRSPLHSSKSRLKLKEE